MNFLKRVAASAHSSTVCASSSRAHLAATAFGFMAWASSSKNRTTAVYLPIPPLSQILATFVRLKTSVTTTLEFRVGVSTGALMIPSTTGSRS